MQQIEHAFCVFIRSTSEIGLLVYETQSGKAASAEPVFLTEVYAFDLLRKTALRTRTFQN